MDSVYPPADGVFVILAAALLLVWIGALRGEKHRHKHTHTNQMKAISITVKNIGIIADATIAFNKPLLILYGEIRQGKTTLLNAFKWVMGGSFPSDIIREREQEAGITLTLDCGIIQRTFYRGRDGATKSRPILFERNGAPVRDAVSEIKKMLNPFLLNQDYLKDMSELERKKYFAELFSVHTDDLDASIAAKEAAAVEVRAELKGYGAIDVTLVEPPSDLEALRATKRGLLEEHQRLHDALRGELAGIRAAHQVKVAAVRQQNEVVGLNNTHVKCAEEKLAGFEADVVQLKKALAVAEDGVVSYRKWLSQHSRQPFQPEPAPPDTRITEDELARAANTTEIDQAIGSVEAQKVRYAQFEKNLARQKERQDKEEQIRTLEKEIRELRNKRLARLKEVSETAGIPGLVFDETGTFAYEGCQAGMLSTSQLMKLSAQLSSLYPEGFGIDLIDRAESLGKSIFTFVERAKRDKRTILAAVVGERPAEVPEEVGVFVVEKGVVK